MPTAPSQPQATRRRLGRILLGLCLGCTGLLILGLVLLPEIVALKPVQRVLVKHIEAALRGRVTIGAVRLQLLRGLEVTLEDVILDNPSAWARSPFLRIGRLSVQVAPLALLERTVAITEMIARDAELVIERDPYGQVNVVDLATSAIVQAPGPPHEASPVGATHLEVTPLASWRIADLALEGGTVTFVDRRSVPGEMVTTSIRDVRGHLRDIFANTPIPFDPTATSLTDGYHNLRAQGRIGPIPTLLAIGKAPIEADLQAEDLLLGALPPSLGGNFPRVGGRMGIDLKVQGRMGGDLNVAGALSLEEGAWPDPMGGEAAATLPVLVSIQKITLNLANGSIQIAEAELDLFSLHATLTGAVTDVHTSPQIDLQLTTTAFSPGDMLPRIPLLASIIPAPTEVQGRAQLQATVTGTPHALRADVQLEVNNGALKSRGIRVETDTIHMSLTTYLAKPRSPHVLLNLRADRLVVEQREANALLPASMPPPGPTPHAPRAHRRLPPVTLNGTIKIAEGRMQHLRFQQLTADVALAQGRLTTTHQATLYGGSYRGMVRMNLALGEPAYTVDASVAGVQLGAAMRMWTSANTVRQGVLTTRVKLSGQGWTWARLRQTLSGDGHATITDFKVRPADPPHVRTRKVTFVSPLGNMTRHIRMNLESIHTVKAILHMRQGHFLSDDLQLWGKDVAIRARGHMGFDQSVTCNGTLTLSGERASAQGILAKLFLRDAYGRTIYPFTVTRRVSDPQLVVNAKDLLGGAIERPTDVPK
jgi:AsmA-like C-terminal region/Domain of Unknown Function (DUF748)